MERQPGHQAQTHRAELATNHDLVGDLAATTDPAGIEIARQHIERLHERNCDLATLIEHCENLQRFVDCGDSPSPDIDAAIERRTLRLAHTAIANHATWVAELISIAHHHNPDIGAAELHDLVVAAYRERAEITGPDPLGEHPGWDHPYLTSYDQLATQLAFACRSGPSSPLGSDSDRSRLSPIGTCATVAEPSWVSDTGHFGAIACRSWHESEALRRVSTPNGRQPRGERSASRPPCPSNAQRRRFIHPRVP